MYYAAEDVSANMPELANIGLNCYIHTIQNSSMWTQQLRFESILVVLVQCSDAGKPNPMN